MIAPMEMWVNNLEELRELSYRLSFLLADAQPGLASWNIRLQEVLSGISEFASPFARPEGSPTPQESQ
jgi:hypothetical protein